MIHLISKKKPLFDHPNIKHYYNEDEISPLLFSLVDQYKYVSVDTETEGFFDFKNKIVMLQLGIEDHQFVFDVRDFIPNVAIEVLNTEDIVSPSPIGLI